MSMPSAAGGCRVNADDQFGPRVDLACRPFDFTLLFEDAFFITLPAALFLVFIPFRLSSFFNTPAKVTTYKLATCKLVIIAILFTLHLLFLINRTTTSPFQTRLALPSSILSTAAILFGGLVSFIEDQLSIQPSDFLVIYFTASAILALPRLRSLWLLPHVAVIYRDLWTAIFAFTVLLVVVECYKKTRFLRTPYKANVTAEQTTNFWSRSFFIWCLPFFQEGYAKILSLHDIPRVDGDLEEERARSRLEKEWAKVKEGKYRLIRAAFKANWWSFASAVPPRVALSAFTFSQPFLIEAAVREMQEGGRQRSKGEENYGKALVGGYVLAYVGIAVSRAIYWRQTYRMIAKIRSGLISIIYRHTTTLQATAVKDSAAITLMGTDVERIVQSIRLVHELWASVPEVAVGIWLLARQLGMASLVPVVICGISLAATSPIAKRFGPAQRAWVERVEKRVAVTANMLGDMKAVKMLGLPGALEKIITKLRVLEMETSERVRGLFVWQIVIGNTPATLAQFVTFAVYAVVSVAKKDEGLLGPQAFASISLIGLVTFPVMVFVQALPSCMQAVACFGRVEEYLLKGDKKAPETPSDPGSSGSSIQLQQVGTSVGTRSGRSLITFNNSSISWSPEASKPVLNDLTLAIRPGLTAIIGPVASGKTTLLATLIGETTLQKGSITPKNLSGVAFCAQSPWIIDDTIRQNIIGGLDFDEKWYNFSVETSGLERDIAGMVAGDWTRAGSNGSALSGGQKQRVALARAIYSRLPVIVLDDVMSGLDPKTAGLVTTRLFDRKTGHARMAGISVVIATHSRRVLPYMDSIIVMDSGRVVDTGSYEEIFDRSARLVEQAEAEVQAAEKPQEEKGGDGDDSTPRLAERGAETAPLTQQEDTTRRSGSWSVYKYYIKSAGITTVLFWILFTFVGAVFTSVMPIWVGQWTAANEKSPNQSLGFYLGVYAAFVVLANIGPFMECRIFFIRVINNTALKLHADLLEATLRAPFSFFQKTDTGTITNRFSQDMDLIDMTLPTQAIQFTTAAASCVVQLVIICILGKYLAAAIPFLAMTLFVVQRYYLRTSRQVRLIDIEAKAPLYKHFIETTQGVATIKAFRWASMFQNRNAEMLNTSQRPFYILLCIQQWLSLVLDLIVGGLAVVLVAVATSTAGSLSPGALGVALVLILEFNLLLIQTIQSWTKLETSIGAVARVRQFVQDTPSEPSGLSVPAEWPAHGAINFHDVSASYSASTPPALSSLTLEIPAGCKLAVCGPSGSGKTTLIMTLLRMIEPTSGDITVDSVDITSLSLDDLRSSFNVVPQDPYFMPGTVRFNLDPRSRATDEEINLALRKVGLEDRVATKGGLNAELDAEEYSKGERQLLCLARAVIVGGKVLILDEAASSVDDETEAIMQGVVEKEFKDVTVISVLHRFSFIERFDWVAVLKQGRLIECDTPKALLETDSVFRELSRAHRK